MTSKMIMFHVPEDQEWLAALGVVTIRHEHLNHILKMTIRSIANSTIAEAVDSTRHKMSRSLRERILKLARQKLGEGDPLLKLKDLLARVESLTDRRNKLIHGLWAKELDGDPGVMGDVFGELLPLPSVDELKTLAREIEDLTNEFNIVRKEGFLKVALEIKRKEIKNCITR